jgi:Mce-associated membrane protein
MALTETDAPSPTMTGEDPLAAPAPRRLSARLSALATGLALLLAVLALAGLVLARRDLAELRQTEDRRAEALAAAEAFAVALTTYDYRTIGDQFAKVAAAATDTPECQKDATGKPAPNATGCFKSEYVLVTGKAFQDVVVQRKATSVGTVRSAGVVSVSDDRAVVLVALDQKVSNVDRPAGSTAENRVLVSLVRQSGRWLVSDVRVNTFGP